MRATTCEREDSILLAARRGGLNDGDRAHLESCAACSAAVAAEAALRAAAREWSSAAGMPRAPQLLLRARLEARRAAAERSLRPIRIWQGLVGAVAAGTVAAGMALWGPIFSAPAASSPALRLDPAGVVLALGLAALTAILVLGRRRGQPL